MLSLILSIRLSARKAFDGYGRIRNVMRDGKR
jgi:hypothetical protein